MDLTGVTQQNFIKTQSGNLVGTNHIVYVSPNNNDPNKTDIHLDLMSSHSSHQSSHQVITTAESINSIGKKLNLVG